MPARRSILIADDDSGLRVALRTLLEQEGYSVEESTAVADLPARMLSAERKPDLVLLDLVMPDANGMDVLRSMRESIPSPLPVVVITAHGSARVTIEAMQLGTSLQDLVGTEVEIALPPTLCWGYPSDDRTAAT